MKYVYLLLILILAAVLRLTDLGNSPPGVLVDEASLGYNAYSVLKTGRDEWNQFLPLTLKSFGDFKPSGYMYFTIPFVNLISLSPLSTRFPSALMGIFAVICIYLIVNSLFRNKYLGLLSAFLLSISSWHINMSRMAWEANVALTLFLLGIVCLLQNKKSYFALTISGTFFSLSLYVYIGYRFLTPVILIPLIFYFWKTKYISKKQVFYFIAIFVLSTSFLIPEIFFKGGLTRFSQVSIGSKSGNTLYINEQRAFCGMQNNQLILTSCYLFWNKPTVILSEFLKNYISNFSFDFLFIKGDIAKFVNDSGHGVLYLWLLPIFITGFLFSIKNIRQANNKILLLWFLLSPIMPAIAGPPHLVRSNMVFIPLIIYCSIGMMMIQYKFSQLFKIKNIYVVLVFILLAVLSTFSYMFNYFFVYTKKAMAWDEYYRDIFTYVNEVKDDYKTVYIKRITNHPYIYTLFYLSINPNYVKDNIIRNNFEVNRVGKYIFADIDLNGLYCQWLKANKPKILNITDDTDLYSYALFYSSSFNKVYKFAAIYDFEKLENYRLSGKVSLPECK